MPDNETDRPIPSTDGIDTKGTALLPEEIAAARHEQTESLEWFLRRFSATAAGEE